MNSNVIHLLAELCAEKGIQDVVICPGSRSAPLTLAFIRNNRFTCRTFSDERSAAFIALAMAQQTGKPVVLICTSGSAACNFAPAVAEAFFQEVPLIVFTADRPREWIDQLDGQTIRQENIYGNHVKRFFELPQEYSHPDVGWHANRIVNEAINLSLAEPKGPVHINAPFREPLYTIPSIPISKSLPRNIIAIPTNQILTESQWDGLTKALSQFRKILIVPGQQHPSSQLLATLSSFHKQHRWPLVGDILSNFHSLPFFCRHADAFLGQMPKPLKQSLQPDLLITFGKSLVAKNIKLFLRGSSKVEHWHIQSHLETADTFQSLTRIIQVTPEYFFSQLQVRATTHQVERHAYAEEWQQHELQTGNTIDDFFEENPQGEFAFLKKVIHSLPEKCNLHLANSMSVRYANHIGLGKSHQSVHVYSNRGTSGIDGCTSTAVGHALKSEVPNVLITGDQAFFYDRNAFWHNYSLPNLFLVLINNHGGIIFNMIDGPGGLPESEEFFITRQALNAKSLAKEFGFFHGDPQTTSMQAFFKPDGKVKIMEMESTQASNKKIFEAFKNHIKQSYEA